jgi:hypothetical protein
VSELQQVHVRVNDAATGKPTPCRVRFTDAAGKYYAPYGRLTEFAMGRGIDVGGNLRVPAVDQEGMVKPLEFAYVDGSCEIALPPGLIHIKVYKGPEYVPIQHEMQLTAGKLALRFTLERWSHLRQQDWYPGDIRAHFLSPQAAVLEGAAEDLAVVNLLACATMVQDQDDFGGEVGERRAYANLLDFSGQEPVVHRAGCMVIVNTHNTHPLLGSLGLLNCHRVVYPLNFGAFATTNYYDNWTLADWCDQCHRKHGLVVWTRTLGVSGSKHYGEALADLILGKVEAIEVDNFGWTDQQHPSPFPWYELLNCGIRVPLVGSSNKDNNYLPLGCVRTYAHLNEHQPLNYAAWIEAVRSGRTFVTNGPSLLLTVNDQDLGATIQIAAGQPVRVHAEARSLVPFEHLEIVVNGEVVARQTPSGGPSTASIETEIRVPTGGWLAARCWGAAWVPGWGVGQRIYAHTSPLYVSVEGRPAPVDSAAVKRFQGHLTHNLSWVNNQGRYENDAQRLRLRKVFEDAIEVLQDRGAV